jgi:ADP-heptose:LPS heptosyltransferase
MTSLHTETKINILVRRRAALGDVIMITPVIRALYDKYQGQVNIDVQTDHAQVFNNHPLVRACIPLSTSVQISDYAQIHNLDGAYENNPNVHFIDTYMHQVLGEHQLSKHTELFASDADTALAQLVLDQIGDNQFIVIHARNWHWEMKNIDQAVWLQILEGLFGLRTDLRVVFTGGTTDWYLNHPLMIDARGLTLAATAQVMSGASCFVGIDSAPFHIAGTTLVPMIALLSHIAPEIILPYRQGQLGWGCEVIRASVPCVGCYSQQPRPVTGIQCIPGGFPCNRAWDTDCIVQTIVNKL